MAELPETEVLAEKLRRAAMRKRIGEAVLYNSKGEAVADGLGEAGKALAGRELSDVRRYGSFLFLETEGRRIVSIQMGGEVSADLERGGAAPEAPRTGMVLRLNGRMQLVLQGNQLPGRLKVLEESSDVDFLTRLGPDPLLVKGIRDPLREALGRRRSAVRNVLLDDTFVPGIGPVWADEILFQARIRPDRPVPKLEPEERERLLDLIPRVLDRAVRCQAKPELLPKTYLTRHRADSHCPGCGGPLETKSVGGKQALFCPVCQT